MKEKYHILRAKLHRIIFQVDTFWAKAFDIFLLLLIILSIIILSLESVENIKLQYGHLLSRTEWVITILFTLEYILRIVTSNKPWSYIKSFWGIVDLLSILPTYFAFFITDTHYFTIIRSLRLIRIFRVLSLSSFENEGKVLLKAMKESLRKIEIFLYTVIVIVIIIGTMMYFIEGAENGFTSIPRGIYWAIVTLTTVGYGDISPQTSIGQLVASIVMILGYAIIAVPTGIISAEMVKAKSVVKQKECTKCHSQITQDDAVYCSNCGEKLTKT